MWTVFFKALFFHIANLIIRNLVRVNHTVQPTLHVNMILLHILYACVYGGWGAGDIDHTWIFKPVVLHRLH